jgi:hypothetical protein
MHEYGSLPRARQDGLLEEAVGEELLLYDRNSHTAHLLEPDRSLRLAALRRRARRD